MGTLVRKARTNQQETRGEILLEKPTLNDGQTTVDGGLEGGRYYNFVYQLWFCLKPLSLNLFKKGLYSRFFKVEQNCFSIF